MVTVILNLFKVLFKVLFSKSFVVVGATGCAAYWYWPNIREWATYMQTKLGGISSFVKEHVYKYMPALDKSKIQNVTPQECKVFGLELYIVTTLVIFVILLLLSYILYLRLCLRRKKR